MPQQTLNMPLTTIRRLSRCRRREITLSFFVGGSDKLKSEVNFWSCIEQID